MRNAARWVLLAGIALVVIGLIAYARGDEHRRGDDVGALRTGAAVDLTNHEAGGWVQ
jgi:hypothetical protein